MDVRFACPRYRYRRCVVHAILIIRKPIKRPEAVPCTGRRDTFDCERRRNSGDKTAQLCIGDRSRCREVGGGDSQVVRQLPEIPDEGSGRRQCQGRGQKDECQARLQARRGG